MFRAGRWQQLIEDSGRFAEELAQLNSGRNRRSDTSINQKELFDWFNWENCQRQDKLWKVLKLPLETRTHWQPFRTLYVAGPRSSERIRIGQRKVQQELEVSSERRCSWAFGDDGRISPTTFGPPINTTFDVSSWREVGQSGCSSVDRGHNPTRKIHSSSEAEWRGEGHSRWRRDSESRGPHSCSTIGSSSGRATAPFQYALSTKAGCECASHVVQALTEANPETTVVSFDGVSAFDLISREAMLNGLLHVD